MLKTLIDKSKSDINEVNSVIVDVIYNGTYTNDDVYKHLAENIDRIISYHADIVLEEPKRCHRL